MPLPPSDATSSNRATPSRPRRWVAKLAGELGPVLTLLLVIAFFAVAEKARTGGDSFLSSRNARTIAVQASTVFVAALGMTVVIIAGGIDLSAGTALALSATVLAWCLRAGWPTAGALAAGLGAGAVAGMLNGVLVSLLKVVPFIITLGTMTIYLGIAKYVADETTVRPDRANVPEWIPALVAPLPEPGWLVVASGVWLACLLGLFVAAMLRYTIFGRYVFAIGSNEQTARLCGVNVPAVKIAVYTLSGLFVGIAGLYQFARLSSGNPTSGIGQELRIIASVVIGGGSLSGGRGSVLGTAVGALMMQTIASGCTLLEIPNLYEDIIIGVIIIAAVAIDEFRARKMGA